MKITKLKLFFLTLLMIVPFTSMISNVSKIENTNEIVEVSSKKTNKMQKSLKEESSSKEFCEYLEPVYDDYQIPDIQLYASDSTKDEFESNNSFANATLIQNNQNIYATLHRDPWYYLFWRDIDEDYYRIDVLGNAKLEIKLTNIPYGCDYDLELYTHNNGTSAGFSSVKLFDSNSFSRKSKGNDELITRNVTPNTYYIRVYPYGEKSYDATNKYKLNVSFKYDTSENLVYSDLKYNLGAGGAVWLSDFDPFGIKAFSSQEKNYAGYHMISGTTNVDCFSNPIFKYLDEEKKIEHSTLYLWDNDWKVALRTIVNETRAKVQTEISNKQKIRAKIELVGEALGVSGSIAGVVLTFVNPTTGVTIAVVKVLSVVASVAPTVYAPLVKSLFPEVWDTSKEKYLDYLNILATALDTTSNTSDDEIVKISSYYKITHTFNALSSTYEYYCDFTPEYDETGYKYDETIFYAYHQNQIFNGKVYSIVDTEDLADAINRINKKHEEINTGGDREITLGTGIIDELNVGEYHWFHFIAPASGYYRFYSEGTTDTYVSLFNQIVPSQSLMGEIKNNDDGGENRNFSLTYKLRANQTIYIRVCGYNWDRTGKYHFRVEAMENVYDIKDTITLSDYDFPEKYVVDPTYKPLTTKNGLNFDTNRLRCGIIDKSYLALSAKRKDAGLAYIEYEFTKTIYTVDFDIAIWSDSEYLNKDSSISFDYKNSEGKWQQYMFLNIAKLSKSKDSLDHFFVEFPEDAYGFRFVVRTNEVNYEQNKGRVVLGDISILYANA